MRPNPWQTKNRGKLKLTKRDLIASLLPTFQQGKIMTVPIKRQQSDERLSKIVEYGNLVFIAGTVADNRGPNDSCKSQTEEVLSKIDSLLKAAGTDKSRLLTANVWVSDIRDKPQMDEAWKAWVHPDNKPARACQETGLATRDTRVEIMVVAAKP